MKLERLFLRSLTAFGMTGALFFCLQTSLYADSKVTISLINHTSTKFVFDRSVARSNNTISIDKQVILPGETATIIGTTTTQSDLSAILYFNGDAHFRILDQLQFHSGQPIFRMVGNYMSSKLLSKTRNPVKRPRLLTVVAASVELVDRKN